MSAFRKSHYLFLYLIIHQTACKMNYTCPCWCTLPRTNQSLIPLLAFLSCFSSPSFPSHLSPRSPFVGTASGCSAGTARAAAWHERNQWHTTPPLLLVLREDLKTGMWGRKVGGERFSQTSAGPRSGASGADTKNKVAAVCFLYSALPLRSLFRFCCSSLIFTFQAVAASPEWIRSKSILGNTGISWGIFDQTVVGCCCCGWYRRRILCQGRKPHLVTGVRPYL